MIGTWTYSGDPSSSDRDAVRFEIGDTISDDPLLYDKEIEYAIAAENGTLSAAARCCEVVAAKFSRLADRSLGPMSIKHSQKAEQYRQLAKDLRSKAVTEAGSDGAPSAGGIYIADRLAMEQNTSLIQPAFKRDMLTTETGEDPRGVSV